MYLSLSGRKRTGFISACVAVILYTTYTLACGFYSNRVLQEDLVPSVVIEVPDEALRPDSENVALHNPSDAHESPTKIEAPRPVGIGTANATMVMLARNDEIDGVLSSMATVENRFNREHGYPWTFLNEVEFTEEFKSRVKNATSAHVSFGLIPDEHWSQPNWIDEVMATKGRKKMAQAKIIYADNVPYRNMCRFNSGFFYKQPILQQYRYYWRVEPNVRIMCDVKFDPFDYLRDNNKIYGFTIAFTEWEKTIPTLWSTVKEFMVKHPEYVNEDNALGFLSDNKGKTYNLCHFWSNFEIADMNFWRSEAYEKFFDYLENRGGFYYERWGDAPVHSIAAALFAPKEQLHFFRNIGYRHEPFQHCPSGADYEGLNCECKAGDGLDYAPQSCIRRYENLFSGK
ncbi:glycosyltransferase family 15 protein [Cylindrobasidium torrendii FP15055 ss-10]|uniref:Glycosyltransferase family 15 protein n=1 Tax=Cylindrobasidium torrendii FP15055 ss-10 TaxID=1314674 RepID=A0A0D7B8G5_9AGAR|nr:glycosyltransferase family 15 protein [Cylindrobasidium torrendii FP15055 ss-10]